MVFKFAYHTHCSGCITHNVKRLLSALTVCANEVYFPKNRQLPMTEHRSLHPTLATEDKPGCSNLTGIPCDTMMTFGLLLCADWRVIIGN